MVHEEKEQTALEPPCDATWGDNGIPSPEDPILEKINPCIEKECCSIILKMVYFRGLKFNIMFNPDIDLILIGY